MLFAVPLWIRSKKHVTLCLACIAIAYHVSMLADYFVAQESTPSNATAFKLVFFNVLRTNEDIEATLTEAVDFEPDFLFLMETGPDWTDLLRQRAREFPYQKLICRKDYTGVAFLSKHPWESLEIVDSPDGNPPLDIVFAIEGSRFRLLLTHPLPPISSELGKARDTQLANLAGTVSDDIATVFAGDFNQTPWSSRFQSILNAGQLTDLSKGYSIAPTLTPLPTWLGGVKVDHALGNRRISVTDFTLGTTQHSDHRPVALTFQTN